jgi:FAD binding domain-containing protein/berberine-like enzyme
MTELIRPGDEGWDSARAAWNVAFDQQPAMVALPKNADEVADAVRTAREAGLRVAVQAEGHNAGALGPVGEDTLLLKTRHMTGADVDAAGGRARVAAAAKWRDVSAPASAEGLAPLAGSSAEVGIVGFTLGGGLGWLGRKWGLACNSVQAAELVTADGELVRADRDNNPDLFWALRGGGGSFGAVTALEFALYEVPQLYVGAFFWPWERSEEVLHAWREWLPGQPDEVSGCARVVQLPPIPEIPEPFRGRDLVVVEVAYLGDEAAGAELTQPLRALGPELDTFEMAPPSALGYLHMDPEDPVPALSGHLMLNELPSQAIDALVEAAGPGSGSPLLSVELRQLGGALAKAAPDAGAMASLNHGFVMFSVGMPMDEETGAAIARHNEVVVDALSPWNAGVKYGNFTEAPTDPRTCFPAETFERLQQVKLHYDPEDVFRANHPIPCAAAV